MSDGRVLDLILQEEAVRGQYRKQPRAEVGTRKGNLENLKVQDERKRATRDIARNQRAHCKRG
jgi:hypothetical protein